VDVPLAGTFLKHPRPALPIGEADPVQLRPVLLFREKPARPLVLEGLKTVFGFVEIHDSSSPG
jgi:hypothetical protein